MFLFFKLICAILQWIVQLCYGTDSAMFSSVFFLYICGTIISHITLNAGADEISQTIRNCKIRNRNPLWKTECKHAQKGDENKPIYTREKESQKTVEEIDYFRNVFECISESFYENDKYSDENLISNSEYRRLVAQCESRRKTHRCDFSSPYRKVDGTCNNPVNPRWGSTLTCFQRHLPANYESVSGLRKSVRDNKPLPNARLISNRIFNHRMSRSRSYNTLFSLFGQPVAHDIAKFPFFEEIFESLDCCSNVEEDQNSVCSAILIDPNDYFYSRKNVSCFDMSRTIACDTCSVAKRMPLNKVTSYIDCSLVYGLTNTEAQILRRKDGTGKLKTQETEAGELLPADKLEKTLCGKVEEQEYCFKAGDTRVNQHTPLMIIQTMLVREHNRIADILHCENPGWNEETLYQEARSILIAEWQVIIFKEYLPIVLGKRLMDKYKLNIGSGYKYDLTIDPTISVEFNAAAFRMHSVIPGRVIFNGNYNYFRNFYSNAKPLYRDHMTSFLVEMTTCSGEKYDKYFTKEVTDWALKPLHGDYGNDLVAFDIQRGRDTGAPTYTEMLQYLRGYTKIIKEFDDLEGILDTGCLKDLRRVYSDVRDIDLLVGLNCELVSDDMIISLTAAEIIGEQFQRLKYGDRFYFEFNDNVSPEQRQTLKKVSLARMICDNFDVKEIQPDVFRLPLSRNQPVLCSEIPALDLGIWKK